MIPRQCTDWAQASCYAKHAGQARKGFTPRADVARTGLKTVADQPDDELSDLHSSALAHDNHKGLHEVILEAVIGQFVPLQELHRQLAQAVHRIDGDVEILVTADIDEEV